MVANDIYASYLIAHWSSPSPGLQPAASRLDTALCIKTGDLPCYPQRQLCGALATRKAHRHVWVECVHPHAYPLLHGLGELFPLAHIAPRACRVFSARKSKLLSHVLLALIHSWQARLYRSAMMKACATCFSCCHAGLCRHFDGKRIRHQYRCPMRVASWPVVGQRATAIGRFLNRNTPPQHRAVVFVPVGKLSWSLRCKPGHSIRVALDGVCLHDISFIYRCVCMCCWS